MKRRPGGRFEWCLAKIEFKPEIATTAPETAISAPQTPSKLASEVPAKMQGRASAIETPPATGKRIALIIGNSKYQKIPPLRNAGNDAELMASTLESVGFRVTKLIDATQKQMNVAISKFGNDIREDAEASLFYYSGHGVQVKGLNYLIPVDVPRIEVESDFPYYTLDVNNLLKTMKDPESQFKIVILDACRDDPFDPSSRSTSGSGGLAAVNVPKGTYIAYATQPGNRSSDGLGKHSPFTAALAKVIVRPGLRLEDVLMETRISVLNATGNRQQPWDSSSLVRPFYFVPTR